MAFRPPREQEQGVPSLGYRLSSNRQPGIEQSNNMMPQYSNPIGRGSRPMPPEAMPMPQYERPIGRPGMGNYQNMGRQSSDPRERYIANTQGGHPNMSQYGYPMPNSGMFSGPIEMGSSMMEAIPMAPFMEEAAIDPSDYRTIMKMIEQGLDPNDYMNRGGIASLRR